MLRVQQKLGHTKGSDTSKTQWVELYFRLSLPVYQKQWEEQRTPSSGRNLPLPVQTLSFLCTEMLNDVVGSAQITAVSQTPSHISNDLTARLFWAISNATALPRTGLFSPVEIWIIVSTYGFDLLNKGGNVKEVQC